MFGLGMGELIVISLLALLLIGPKKLPELAKGLGKGLKEFQKAKDNIFDQVNDATSLSKSEQDSSIKTPKESASVASTKKSDDTEIDEADAVVLQDPAEVVDPSILSAVDPFKSSETSLAATEPSKENIDQDKESDDKEKS